MPREENKPVVQEKHVFSSDSETPGEVSPSDLHKRTPEDSNRPSPQTLTALLMFLTSPGPLAIQGRILKRITQPKWEGHITLESLSDSLHCKMAHLSDQAVVRVTRDNV